MSVAQEGPRAYPVAAVADPKIYCRGQCGIEWPARERASSLLRNERCIEAFPKTKLSNNRPSNCGYCYGTSPPPHAHIAISATFSPNEEQQPERLS
jgi:hypothetical protein